MHKFSRPNKLKLQLLNYRRIASNTKSGDCHSVTLPSLARASQGNVGSPRRLVVQRRKVLSPVNKSSFVQKKSWTPRLNLFKGERRGRSDKTIPESDYSLQIPKTRDYMSPQNSSKRASWVMCRDPKAKPLLMRMRWMITPDNMNFTMAANQAMDTSEDEIYSGARIPSWVERGVSKTRIEK